MGGPAFLGQWYAEGYSKYDCSKAVEKQGMHQYAKFLWWSLLQNVYFKEKEGDRASPRQFRYIRFENGRFDDEVEYSAVGMWPIADIDITAAQPGSFSRVS